MGLGVLPVDLQMQQSTSKMTASQTYPIIAKMNLSRMAGVPRRERLRSSATCNSLELLKYAFQASGKEHPPRECFVQVQL